MHNILNWDAWFLATVFAASAAMHLAGIAPVRRAYQAWGYPSNFYRVTGALELLCALFLALPNTRPWGVILAGAIAFASTITLLNHRQYAWSVPGIVMLALLPPAMLAS